MQHRRIASEPEVVLAFLRGELDSERFSPDVRRSLVDAGGLELVLRPDLASEQENLSRERALRAARGWRAGTGLFAGFPDRVDWSHGELEPDELSRVRFIDYSYWNELSGGSRRPGDVLPTLRRQRLAEWVSDLGTTWVVDLAERLADVETVDDLVVMATPDLSDLVVLEGHARLAAVFVGGHEHRLSIRAYVGSSPSIREWELF